MLKNLICSLLLPEEFAPAFAGYVVRKSGVEDAGQVSRDMYIAEVAKLVDAPGLGPDARNGVGVRVPLLAPQVSYLAWASHILISMKRREWLCR